MLCLPTSPSMLGCKYVRWGLPWRPQMVKNLLVMWETRVRDLDSMPGFGRSPGGGDGNPLHCSCLENPWSEDLVGYSPWGHKESDTTRWLNTTMLGDTECWSCPLGICCQNSAHSSRPSEGCQQLPLTRFPLPGGPWAWLLSSSVQCGAAVSF